MPNILYTQSSYCARAAQAQRPIRRFHQECLNGVPVNPQPSPLGPLSDPGRKVPKPRGPQKRVSRQPTSTSFDEIPSLARPVHDLPDPVLAREVVAALRSRNLGHSNSFEKLLELRIRVRV